MKNHIQYFIIIIFLMSGNAAFGQSSEEIYVTCLLEYDTIASDRGIVTDEYGCFSDFIFPLEAKLNTHGFELIKQDNYQLSTDLDVIAEMATRSQLLYHIMPTNSEPLAPSSLLNRHLKSPTSFYLNNGFYFFVGDYVFDIDQEAIDMALGLLFYDKDRCDLALPYFESVAEEVGSQSDFFHMAIQFYKGNCAILDNDIEQAIVEFEAGINLTDVRWNSLELPTNLAWAYIQIGNNESAFELFEQLWEEMNSEDYPLPNAVVTYYQSRAQLYALTFDYIAAIEDIDTAINTARVEGLLMESRANLYKQRGDIIMLIYEWNRALEDYNTAIDLNPDYAEAYYRRGILLYTMVERENAIADFETYLELAPDGQFTESAIEYIESIQTELDALGG